ncbi:RNA polymerase sigma factor [Thalassotalea ponticola]|uniref:RNA polymerase sigma factor n=1 Tax=Thalassotalea ponticola TaxID=1523392 RepID=UPI0025B512A8|nr:RNA polymerase sigma factor [Thalassotalea ponticola]MDN3651753.1 RNA polymerase sigma factor [Thalassotalea ponticola]
MFERSEKSLIKLAQRGNKSAWMKLIGQYEKQVYNYALRMVGNRDDALDLMQDIFISVFRNLTTFRGDSQFKTWLYRIAHYRCVEFYRRHKPTLSLDESPPMVDDSNQFCPLTDAEQQSQAKRLTIAMQTLSVNQRVVIELKFFHHFTFEEIATQIGVSSNTVKSRLYAALDKLKHVLEVEYV